MKLIIKTIACTIIVLLTCYLVFIFFVGVPYALQQSKEQEKEYRHSIERTSKATPKTLEQRIYENNKAKEQYIFKPKQDSTL